MRVGFNALFLGQEATGSGQYTRHLLKALAQQDERNEYLLYQLDTLGSSRKPGSWNTLPSLEAHVLRTDGAAGIQLGDTAQLKRHGRPPVR